MKIKTLLTRAVILACCALLVSCGKDDTATSLPPVIKTEGASPVYTVKTGKTLTIFPVVENAENALYAWKIDGKIVGTEKSFSFSSNEIGSVFVNFSVRTDYGSDETEFRINVAGLSAPSVSLPVPEKGYSVLTGKDLVFEPEVENSENATFLWKVDSKEVGTQQNYTFNENKAGKYEVVFAAANEDGRDEISFTVTVNEPSDMPFSWKFERESYSMSSGRTIRLLPYGIENAFNAVYTWSVDGNEKQSGKDPLFVFTAEERAEPYRVTVTMKNEYTEISRPLTVRVAGPEGTYFRPSDAVSQISFNKVYEFTPAPGQFVNEDYDASTPEQACAYAEDRLSHEYYVSLGGFGGYIVVGFDHSIVNDGGYNFQVLGNSFKGSSEPGVVWVMQDENGNGLPDDTWYELKGSEYDNPQTVQDYEVTYYRPRKTGQPVQWTDNRGKSGSIDYLPAWHNQDFYYPNWVSENTYILRGTCLPSKTREVTPGYWSNDEYEWGYADNFSPIDRLTDDDNHDAGVNANHFRIGDAVTFDRKPAELKYIDFVKVQTGVNAKAGWLGENSTEVFGIRDFNLIKSK